MRPVQIISNPARVYAFVREYVPVNMTTGMQALGLMRGDELVAGVLYESYNGRNIWMHVAAAPGRHWLNREFLRVAFTYPFVQLGCERISVCADSSNTDAIRFNIHLGFKQEAVLYGAAADGGDVIIFAMWRGECKYAHTK